MAKLNQHRREKKAARERQARTGESYSAAAEYGELLGVRLPRVFTADEHREAGYPDARQGETYLVTFDEPDAEGYLGRRLELVFVVVPGTKSDHDLVEKRFRELHQNAVDVRVVYA